MTQALLVVGLALTPLVTLAGSACGQSSARRVEPYIALAAGGGAFPRVFAPTCSSRDGTTSGAAAEARVGLRIGRLLIESRTSRQGEFAPGPRADCVFFPPLWESGTHGMVVSPAPVGGITATDVRAGYVFGARPVTIPVTGGVGRVWSGGPWLLVASSGIRVGGGALRFAVDAEVEAFRVPWDTIVAEWDRFRIVRQLSRSRRHEWNGAVGVRAGIELGL